MQKLFIETKYQGEIELPKDLLKELPEKLILACSIQFIDHLPNIKKELEAYKKKVYLFTSPHSHNLGQLLGCDQLRAQETIDCFLYIGDGEFHPRALLINEKPIFCYNPLSEEVKKLGRKDREELKLRKKVSLMKFYNAQKVGIIISTKEKQKELQGKVNSLKEKLEKEGKETYLFLCDEIKEYELTNFNFIDCWINTACPRISDDIKNLVNLRDLP